MIFVFRKTNGQEVFWKGVNEITNEFEFTTDKNKALHRSSGYYADAERDFINYHVKQKFPELVETMKVVYEDEYVSEGVEA